MDKEMKIYRLFNAANGKSYIGMTHDLPARLARHRYDCRTETSPLYHMELYEDIRKIGWKNIFVEILETCDSVNAGQKERYWINVYDSVRRGYNQSMGGYGNSTISDSTVAQMIETYKTGEKNCTQIARELGIDRRTVSHKLRENGINIRPSYPGHNHKAVYGQPLNTDMPELSFRSITDAGKYIAAQRGSKKSTVISYLHKMIDRPERTAYGYQWSSIDWKKGQGSDLFGTVISIITMSILIFVLHVIMFFVLN